ncbi:dihydroorotate dehydrogenase (NAD+) catalytic subunit [Halopolyspora algeriensis]|uniref:Dihydroorotate dehydrogenase (NAD+) catalytic subunit n=1 Tax=Halopolyspora algeriensis TaxID=1500506 RepID=A0A368VJ00_9ACTN|nr:dihydroorotate dehydrogenase [Halopolyspora algeriensis]RCW40371.1 dihydroorotate dehydrogenase (NAD+) catalytic subunit [Halopolyspora algeriensis]TQM53655.1 dihydroorotate dehydrogenase (NAD+) catalytic subunit [Halopolyspora algeriensis]
MSVTQERNLRLVRDEPREPAVRLGDIALRNRLVTSSSLLGYGVANKPLFRWGMSPISTFVPLERFGAVTTRTLTLQPREGHFVLRDDWNLNELPGLLRRYGRVLQQVDGGWLNAFGWCNVGIDAYLRDYYPRTREQNRIISVGGFSAEEFVTLVDRINAAVPTGEIAAVEFNVSCHNVNFDFNGIIEEVLAEAVPRSNHPVILKLSPDYDYLAHARLAAAHGVSALTAINTVKGLRLDPDTGQPLLSNGFGGLSGRAIKPVGLRVISELRDAGVTLPIIATGGIRSFDDCREYFWAGADAVSLGSASWFASYPGYALSPLHAARIRRLLKRIEHYEPPRR